MADTCKQCGAALWLTDEVAALGPVCPQCGAKQDPGLAESGAQARKPGRLASDRAQLWAGVALMITLLLPWLIVRPRDRWTREAGALHVAWSWDLMSTGTGAGRSATMVRILLAYSWAAGLGMVLLAGLAGRPQLRVVRLVLGAMGLGLLLVMVACSQDAWPKSVGDIGDRVVLGALGMPVMLAFLSMAHIRLRWGGAVRLVGAHRVVAALVAGLQVIGLAMLFEQSDAGGSKLGFWGAVPGVVAGLAVMAGAVMVAVSKSRVPGWQANMLVGGGVGIVYMGLVGGVAGALAMPGLLANSYVSLRWMVANLSLLVAGHAALVISGAVSLAGARRGKA